ncbi:hypothetical protein [Pseudarthrobacter sp. NIBRBAC000502771]|uniref:hypothetical protein n=1 Tax=Pseudarthrobacter sp. NIBRBAC000502771 TaxID=2590774 RepID=UPI001130B5C3|nr:hypothetical protein [Pseudarthrobacter sp. NIBRBAC000502771]QDG61256.1 hypothetical protein NIBR502771_02315 [Pseudarthrobacter sp. NIBRBAC000502771]
MGDVLVKHVLPYAAAFVAITLLVLLMPWSMGGDKWSTSELCSEYQRITASGPASVSDLADIAKHAPGEMAEKLLDPEGAGGYMNRTC